MGFRSSLSLILVERRDDEMRRKTLFLLLKFSGFMLLTLTFLLEFQILLLEDNVHSTWGKKMSMMILMYNSSCKRLSGFIIK